MLAEADWEAILEDPSAESYVPADLTFDGETVPQVAVRTKGNSSLRFTVEEGSIRFPFKVDINYFTDDQELRGERKLNLNPGFKDPSFMREHIAYAVARELGIPAPRTAFVDLYVNEQHFGLYTLVEQVDGDFLEENFEDDEGDLYKPEMRSGTLSYLGSSIDSYPDVSPKTNEDTTDHAAFLALVAALDQSDAASYEAVLDVDEVLRYVAFDAALVNLDSYSGSGHNYYLYEQGGVFSVIPWDLNEAFGLFNCSCDRAGIIGLRIDEPTCGPLVERPLIARLLAVEEYRDRYHADLVEMFEGPLSVGAMDARITEVEALLRPYVEADPMTPYPLDQFEAALDDGATSRGGAIGLRAFVEERGANIAAQLAGSEPEPRVADGEGSCQSFRPGGQEPCGDGVCDDFERANPGVCPGDCEPT